MQKQNSNKKINQHIMSSSISSHVFLQIFRKLLNKRLMTTWRHRYPRPPPPQRSNKRSIKLTHPSADRNSTPISAALYAQVDTQTPGLKLLEIASGHGQHAGFLAPLLPNITFQPTEFDRENFQSISCYAHDCPTKNILEPLFVDISQEPSEWHETRDIIKPESYDYMFNSNMMHISPFACSIGLFRAAGEFLKPNGLLFTYGPYAQDGVLTPESNVRFNRSLKGRNPAWGVRDITELKKLAAENFIELKQIQEMPANNKFLTWKKLQ